MSSYLSNKDGIVRFAIKEPEEIVFKLEPESFLVNVNNCEFIRIMYQHTREIHVQTVTDYSFKPSHHIDYLKEIFADLGLEKGYALDIGAHDGRNHSNTLHLFTNGWKGLAIEGDNYLFARMAMAYQVLPQVDIVKRWITPKNIVPLLQAYDVPKEFDFLSLDIDSYDYFVLDCVLEHYHPTFIMCEINEVIPPPIRFSMRPEGQLDLNTRFYGQSLAALNDLAEKHGYVIIRTHYMDAFLIDKKFVLGESPSLQSLFQEGLLDQEIPHYYSAYPFDVRKLWQATPEEGIEMIRKGYEIYKGEFELSLEAFDKD